MRAPARSKTSAVEPLAVDDRTEPDLGPFVPRPSADALARNPIRSRRETLVSPIPALLAASMIEIREEQGDVKRLAAPAGGQLSRLAIDQRESLPVDDESDYLVEIDSTS